MRLLILTHWGRVTHMCVSKLTTMGSDNGLSPGRHQDIIWTNAGILSIWTLETNLGNLKKIHIFSVKKMHSKFSQEIGGHCVSASMCLTHWGLKSPFADVIFHCIFLNENSRILSNTKVKWRRLMAVHLTIIKHWIRPCLGTRIGDSLNLWCYKSTANVLVTSS